MSCGFMFPPDPNNSLDLDLSNRQTMLSLDILEAQVQCWFFSYVSIVFYYSWMHNILCWVAAELAHVQIPTYKDQRTAEGPTSCEEESMHCSKNTKDVSMWTSK